LGFNRRKQIIAEQIQLSKCKSKQKNNFNKW